MLNMRSIFVFLSVLCGWSGWCHPNGPTNCYRKPNHSGKEGGMDEAKKIGITVTASKIEENTWQVDVTGKFKGILINAKDANGKDDAKGKWYYDRRNFQSTFLSGGNCVAHKNSRVKEGLTTFKFDSDMKEKPLFNTTIVVHYSQFYTSIIA